MFVHIPITDITPPFETRYADTNKFDIISQYGIDGVRQCAQPRVNHLAGGNPVRKGSSQAIGSKFWACIGNSASQAWNVRSHSGVRHSKVGIKKKKSRVKIS